MGNVLEGEIKEISRGGAEAHRDVLGQDDFVVKTVLGDLVVSPLSISPQGGERQVPLPGGGARGGKVSLLIRPEAGRLAETDDIENVIRGVVADVSFRGRYQIVSIRVGDVVLKLEMETAVILPIPGSAITIALDKNGILPLEGA
jgi:ABC-type sugar transport system ATPase subunit